MVHARKLAGVVTDKTHQGIPGVLVEECTANWGKALTSTRTDEDGKFMLPVANSGAIHYLRASKDDFDPLLVRVKISRRAGSLVLELYIAT